MRTVLTYSLLFLTAFWIWSCGSSQKTAGEQSIDRIEDTQVRSQAKELMDKIKDNPNNPEYRRQLAQLHSENGNNLEAMKVLEEGLALDPADAETRYLYAEIALNAGDKIKAYESYRDILQSASGPEYLDRIAPKFSDAFRVTPIVSSSAQEAFGNFSDDGNKIIYQSDQNGNWDIFEYDLVSQNIRQLTDSPAHEENPDYSPDGENIVYTSTVDDHRDVPYNQLLRDIYVKNLITLKEQNLTTNSSNDWRPRYSFDGKLITFVSERNDMREVPFYELFGNIFLMENDGRFQIALTNVEANNGSPCIAPGSTEQDGAIYFDSNRNGNYAIFRTDLKGSDVQQITFNPDVNDLSPDISAQGDKIVFFSDRDGNHEIYMMNTDGSAQQRLTANPFSDLNPVFSPDGTKVLFHSDRDGNYDLFLLDLSRQSEQPPLLEVVSRIERAISALE